MFSSPRGPLDMTEAHHSTSTEHREEESTMSALSQDVMRAIEIERLRIARRARRARGLGR